MLRQAREMIGNRLAGAGKNERSAAEHRAQENLQSAITADVVERAPYRRGVGGTAAGDGRREPGKIVHHHLRHARRARGQQYPFGANGNGRRLVARSDRRRAGDANGERERRMRRANRRRSRSHRFRLPPSRRRDDRPRYRAAGSPGAARRRQARSAPAPSSAGSRSSPGPNGPPDPRAGCQDLFGTRLVPRARSVKRTEAARSQINRSAGAFAT